MNFLTDFSLAPVPRRAGRATRLALLAVLLALLPALRAAASHIRAGDIQARSDPNNLLLYHFKLRLYLDDRSSIPQNTAPICFGDGSEQTFPLTTFRRLDQCIGVTENTYEFSHAFPGPGPYTISFTGENRNGTILNIDSPLEISFYTATTIRIDATTGPNTTPVFAIEPIQQGARGRRFEHAPAATDVTDNDSISYQLEGVVPQQGRLGGSACDPPVDVSPFRPLTQYASAPGIVRMDPQTGLLTWDAPSTAGEFNIAYLVHEYRSLGGGFFREVSVTRRDMQITIVESSNHPPELEMPADTCVVANTTLTKLITATDPDNQLLTLVGAGGPFLSAPAATLTNVSTTPLVKRFRWTPDCGAVARQPYLATFTATDTVRNCEVELATSRVWRIQVVGPAPQNVRADNATVRQIQLHWSPYECRAAADSIRIYRRENSANFTPEACQTGIPPNLGYVYIGSVAATDTVFYDQNRGRRFKRGSTYCYRIYATWPLPAGGESLPSAEACATIPGLLPLLTNATVDATDAAAGQVTVKWTKGDPGPQLAIFTSYYRLSRAADDAPTAFTLVRDRIPLTDTTHVDSGLNTEQRQYLYRLEFVDEDLSGVLTIVDTVATATTPRLSGGRNGAQINLTWTYAVPWDNTTRLHYIYRRIANQFTLIDSVQATPTGGAYTDRFVFGGIAIGQENPNCYRILTRGTYVVGTRDSALTRNFSQDQCVKNEPCPPVLSLLPPDCGAEATTCPESFRNELSWVPSTAPECATDLAQWRIYFRPGPAGAFTRLDSVPSSQLTYSHGPLTSRVGCYAVAAVDSAGMQSALSNIVCQDNCELLILPNIISPNGDSRNDTFEPICASPVRRIKFTVYNRWGVRVYEGEQDPRINWGGTATGGQRLSDGTYFYRAEVDFDLLTPTTRFFKGWVEIAGSREPGGK